MSFKKSLIVILFISLVAFVAIFLSQRSIIDSQLPLEPEIIGSENPVSTPLDPNAPQPDDFSCQPNECEAEIKAGINNVAYPSCNPIVQINNTGASNKRACDYWRNQQKYFGKEEYVNLSELSRKQKISNNEIILDGFLGLKDDIQVHKNAAIVFLKAEAEFNKEYGSGRVGSTYYLPSYPDGYTFEFSGSLSKRAIRGTKENTDGLLYEGEYITPSNHFWGAAIDFNSPKNFGNRFGAKCSLDIPPEVVSIFESIGLRWGGRFFSDSEDVKYFDPMHFEIIPDCMQESVFSQFEFN